MTNFTARSRQRTERGEKKGLLYVAVARESTARWKATVSSVESACCLGALCGCGSAQLASSERYPCGRPRGPNRGMAVKVMHAGEGGQAKTRRDPQANTNPSGATRGVVMVTRGVVKLRAAMYTELKRNPSKSSSPRAITYESSMGAPVEWP